ncbi:hypothetical protein PFDSM3638_04420 [Pyrococcus furiosus DSM 3638]|uniref:Uncharacterized protein n=2 Tax=Pyrococcus furiosus TaxID=2261 RepID=A0A5C0XPY4_PYRFU|nr:hypothetical protein [Pyrococcus furiosus]AFN03674.1 hypothetical protein PFC_03625 [Pyrococcus furiosus COM1]MDK2869785.1 hypothetical protein [Pyrococcus sp.]QEK78555.1 hypothetical protein PFDSM3638_04420 [Pyrococcus furiosus DSM 3638]
MNNRSIFVLVLVLMTLATAFVTAKTTEESTDNAIQATLPPYCVYFDSDYDTDALYGPVTNTPIAGVYAYVSGELKKAPCSNKTKIELKYVKHTRWRGYPRGYSTSLYGLSSRPGY